MKKIVFYVLTLVLTLSSCSFESDEDNQDISKPKTYYLLTNLINYIDKNLMSVVPDLRSSLHPIFPTEFNKILRSNKEATTLFEREDCVEFLISTYETAINTNKYLMVDVPNCIGCYGFVEDMWYFYLEWVLSSEMFMYKMNINEKVELMELALERINYEKRSPYPFNILISIMLSSNYNKFVQDVKPMLIELSSYYYGLKSNDYYVKTVVTFVDGQEGTNLITEGYISVPGLDEQASDLIQKYAQQFINDNK